MEPKSIRHEKGGHTKGGKKDLKINSTFLRQLGEYLEILSLKPDKLGVSFYSGIPQVSAINSTFMSSQKLWR